MTTVLSYLIYYVIRLLNLTYRYTYLNVENLEFAKRHNVNGTYAYAAWHQNIMAGIMSTIGSSFVVIVSLSKDGDLVATTLEKLGNRLARGSSSRGGKKAMTEMIELMRLGFPAALSVDGPRGPAREVKSGIVEIARVTNSCIVPYIVYSKCFWSFNSWDKFRFPIPFTRIVIKYGNPIIVPEDVSREKFEQIKIEIKSALEDGEQFIIKYLNSTLCCKKKFKKK